MISPYHINLVCVNKQMINIHGWPDLITYQVESQYRNFLLLKNKYPDLDLPPSREIDEYWHNHILFTEKYHEDCKAIFGKYLHHFPGEKKGLDINKLFEDNTQRLYYAELKEYLFITYPKLYKGSIMQFIKKLFAKKKAKPAVCL